MSVVRLVRIDGCTYASEHAWGSAADLEMVLADLGSVEHGVEGGDLVDLHVGHFEDLGSLVHGAQRQEVVVLLLGSNGGRGHDSTDGVRFVWI